MIRFGLTVAKGSPLAKWLKAHRLRLLGVLKTAPVPKPTKIYMYDDVSVNLIPRNARYVAAYVDGHWQTILKIKLRCPRAKIVSIAVFPQHDADCLDCEPGDATNAQAPAWVKRQRARRKAGAKCGTKLPWLYTSASNGNALNDTCRKAGLQLHVDYEWWSAHYNNALGEHFCNPTCYPGLRYTASATQFTDRANNVSLDESVCSPDLFT